MNCSFLEFKFSVWASVEWVMHPVFDKASSDGIVDTRPQIHGF